MRSPQSVPAEGLLLRPWTPDDVGAVGAAATDALIARWNPIRAPAAAWVAARGDWADGTHASWAVVDPAAPDIVLGAVSLYHLDAATESGELGFWVLAAHRGRGVAARAARAAAGFAFGELALHRVELFHAVGNRGSCAVARAAGFRFEGVHRQSYRYGEGAWHDEHSHARLAAD